jgi:hypothetical protein
MKKINREDNHDDYWKEEKNEIEYDRDFHDKVNKYHNDSYTLEI